MRLLEIPRNFASVGFLAWRINYPWPFVSENKSGVSQRLEDLANYKWWGYSGTWGLQVEKFQWEIGHKVPFFPHEGLD